MTINEQSNPDLLNLDQAAAHLRVHEVTLRKLAAEGSVPATKTGKEWRFSRQALVNYFGEPESWPAQTPRPTA